ncbi:MAG: Asp-tRNA(Asn)/Glu-tRNA(Gln) amidotransferase subunit GatC [Chloroflexi bacterium]|nr:Asp-tRNA(Asn)/Glu-tRNA(Gln) amidotransferase subunit GatC [Chloroflexota bacterium]
MTKKITEEQVAGVAHLARLELEPEELAVYTEKLGGILEYVDKLQELDTEGIEATFQVVPMSNVFREDESRPGLSVDEVLQNAPERSGDYFKMPPILESEDAG